MIDRCPLFSKSRPVDVSCRLQILYYFPFHFLIWFEISVMLFLFTLPVIDIVRLHLVCTITRQSRKPSSEAASGRWELDWAGSFGSGNALTRVGSLLQAPIQTQRD